ncbi:UDP-N-acetylmuramoyl-tripeptide-D-alanyl-D-alanine ligase [candidate division SR1 bacterium RAAC1_SR1_1]|nr:UDP-N-acetylmuramoyl-tripeptide-D-alanyl-D-alanine ligase [candidate division SR1 bacterium RAAC1_SR1_1]
MKQKILFLYYQLLGGLARRYLKKHNPYIIGINGSVGKTSCRMIITQTLQHFFPTLKISTSSKNFNGELGLSLSIFEIESWSPNPIIFLWVLIKTSWKLLFGKKPYDIIVLEYGIDRPKEMEFLVSIAKPDIGVFTAIDAVHSEQFGDPAAIAHEEVKMIKNTKEIAFLNFNDNYAMQLAKHIDIDTFTYQTEGHKTKSDIYFDNIVFEKTNEIPNSEFNLWIKEKKHTITTNLFGKSNYGYIGVALAIADIVGYKASKKFFKSMENYHKKDFASNLSLNYILQPGRFSVFPGIQNTILFDSTYNASPLSMKSIISTVWSLKQELYKERPLWLVLGDMRELGDFTEREHRLLAAYVSQVADRIFLIGEQMTSVMADELNKIGYEPSKMYRFSNCLETSSILKKMLANKEFEDNAPLLVLKGSQNTIFLEETVKELLKNKDDARFLTRQSKWWLRKKKRCFLCW